MSGSVNGVGASVNESSVRWLMTLMNIVNDELSMVTDEEFDAKKEALLRS